MDTAVFAANNTLNYMDAAVFVANNTLKYMATGGKQINKIKEIEMTKRTQVMEPKQAQANGSSRTQILEETPEPTAWLVVKGSKGEGRSFPVNQGETLIGRSDDCQVRIPDDDAGASRIHAKLQRRPLGTFVYDCGSTNGTLVNGELVPSKKLKAGDVIEWGIDGLGSARQTALEA